MYWERSYFSWLFSLYVIDCRTGRFLLQSSKSILTSSILEEFEDALNQGSISAVDAFINLRSKSILHFFAAIGKFLGLEVVIVCLSLLFKFTLWSWECWRLRLMQVYEHGGRACWQRVDDWEKCKQRVSRTVEVNGSAAGDLTQGKLKLVADSVQRTLHLCLQGLREGGNNNNNTHQKEFTI